MTRDSVGALPLLIPLNRGVCPLSLNLSTTKTRTMELLMTNCQCTVTLTAGMWPTPPSSAVAAADSSSTAPSWRIPAHRLPLLAALFCGAALVSEIATLKNRPQIPSNTSNGITYSDVVKKPKMVESSVLLIKPANGRMSSDDLLKEVTSSINPAALNIQINSTRKTKDGIAVHCKNDSSLTTLKNGLSNKFGGPHLPNDDHPGRHWLTGGIPAAMPNAATSATTVVFAERGRCYTNRLMTVGPANPSPWYTPRVIGGPQCTHCPGQCQASGSTASRRQRPVSQPIPTNYDGDEILPRSPLPEISEFAPNSTQYASSSILDEVAGKEGQVVSEPTLKTRSLPAWVRSKPRPLSTEDDINDLYAKVNFSKKRKNRMRNDEAAIIALSKSRSQFLHKDTDSLVDNEAVIVYDERTAL
nr:unnamed protein product [Callosobruchus analis]